MSELDDEVANNPLVKKLFKKKCNIYKELLSEPSRAYITIGGVLEEYREKFPTFKIKYILKEYYHFDDKQISAADTNLKDLGYIHSVQKGRGWYKLSKYGKKYYEKIKGKIQKWDMFVEDTLHIFDRIPNTGFKNTKIIKKLRGEKKKIGRDLLIWVDGGENKRLIGAIKGYKDRCRTAYILHDPRVDKNFIGKIKKMLTEKSTCGVRTIEVEGWNIKKFGKEIDFIDGPRRQLDIIFSAFPRSAVVCLYLRLNYPETKYPQRWIYNEAEKYTADGDVEFTGTLKGANDRGELIMFGENQLTRYQNLEVFKAINIANKVSIGIGNSSIMEPEYTIDRLSRSTMDLIESPEKEFFPVSYGSVYDIVNKLRYKKPWSIILSGNRVIALGIAMYYSHCLKNDPTNVPRLIWSHVNSGGYSEGVGSHNMDILSIDRWI